MILRFFANLKSSFALIKNQKVHLVQVDSSSRDYNGTSYFFNVRFQAPLKIELEKCSVLPIKAQEDEAPFLTFLAVHFSPHRPIFIRCQERDTEETLMWLTTSLAIFLSEKHCCTFRKTFTVVEVFQYMLNWHENECGLLIQFYDIRG